MPSTRRSGLKFINPVAIDFNDFRNGRRRECKLLVCNKSRLRSPVLVCFQNVRLLPNLSLDSPCDFSRRSDTTRLGKWETNRSLNDSQPEIGVNFTILRLPFYFLIWKLRSYLSMGDYMFQTGVKKVCSEYYNFLGSKIATNLEARS